MLDGFSPFDTTKNGKRYFVGLSVVVVGYAVALTGSLASFRIPIALSSGMTLLGLLSAMFLSGWIAPRLAIERFGRAFIPAFVIGTLVIAAMLAMFARSDWTTWYLHPTGFQSAWIVLVVAYFHFVGIFKRPGMNNLNSENSVTEYNEDQVRNPYAPPMSPELGTNNPMDRSGGPTAS